MRFFKLLRHVPYQTSQQQRSLLIFPRPKKENVIGNFTAIFAVLASLEHHGRALHPNMDFVCPPFWLDQIHPFYRKETWGQTKAGLPKIASKIFNRLYPNHPENQYITWGQVQQLRLAGLSMLEQRYNIPVYHGDPVVTKCDDGRFRIDVINPTQSVSLYSESNAHFYFWYKIAQQYKIGGVFQRASTEAYQQPPETIPDNMDIIVIGSGLSVVWLAKYFATPSTNRRIICIKYPTAQLIRDIPANSHVDYNRIITLDVQKTHLSLAKNDPHFAVVYSDEYKQEFIGPFFSAIGVESPEYIVKDVPPPQLTSPSQWLTHQLTKSRSSSTTPPRWVAPKNIPIGSFKESIARWFEITDNMKWGFEPQSYHEATDFFNELINNNFSSTLNLDMRFFEALGHALICLDNPMPDHELNAFLLHIYEEVYAPTKAQSSLFIKEVDALFGKSPSHEFTV